MDSQLPKPGSYVVAVSGGVDSVALLHWLQAQRGLKLTVAHFDHGMRNDSREDREHVQKLAHDYKIPFVYDEGRLGPGASEATARAARYEFLRKVQLASKGDAIITAHHQDDVLETAIINMLRGTGRRGLTALQSRRDVQRPLIDTPKRQILDYARAHELVWREDSTNVNTEYLRNYVRHNILPRFNDHSRSVLWELINDLRLTNQELDHSLIKQLELQPEEAQLDREYFAHLPYTVAREVMAAWLRAHDIRQFTSRTLERLVVAGKTGATGQTYDVLGSTKLRVRRDHLALVHAER